MKPIDCDQLHAQLHWRYATKVFDPTRKISPKDWAVLEEALWMSPSSYGLEPWQFLVVTSPALREQLMPVSNAQRQIVDASHMVVFTVKTTIDEAAVNTHVDRLATARGVPKESLSNLRDRMVAKLITGMNPNQRIDWEARQAYLALGTFLNCAAMLGIDACPMEGLQPTKYDEILGLAALGLTTVVVATAGYRAATDKFATIPKVRLPKGDVIRYV